MAKDLGLIKSNVATMIAKGASEQEIDDYISLEGSTVDEIRSFSPSVTKSPVNNPNQLQSAARGALQGGSFGFGDEVAGFIGAGLARAYDKLSGKNLFEGESFGQTYQQGRDVERDANQAAQEANPGTYFAGELGGGLLAPVKGLQAVKGASLPIKAAKGAAAGVGIGAASGTGYSEANDIGGIIEDASIGAAIGGSLGGAIPAAGKVVRGLGNNVKNLVVGRSADAVLANRLAGKNIGELIQDLQSSGDSAFLADVAGDEVKGLMRLVGRTPGGPKNIITEALENRSQAAVERVTNDLTKNISRVDTYFGNLDDIAKARAKMAAPFYKRAYEKASNIGDRRLDKFLQDERIQSALMEAKKKYGVRLEAPERSLEALDGVKKVLDDKIGAAMRSGEKQFAASNLMLKNQLLEILDGTSKDYKKARKIFSDFHSMEEAQKEGLSFSKKTPEQIRRYLGNLSPSERDAYKIGVRENLQRTVDDTADGADPAKRIFGNTNKRKRLQTVFGESQFNKFARRMREETRMADTKFKVMGGSRTDINVSDEGQLIDIPTSKSDLVRKGINKGTEIVQRRFSGINQKNAEELARVLTSKEEGLKALGRIFNKK